MNWRELNHILASLSEEKVLELLNAERVGAKRVSVLERLHQRYSTLRATRERLVILQEARNV